MVSGTRFHLLRMRHSQVGKPRARAYWMSNYRIRCYEIGDNPEFRQAVSVRFYKDVISSLPESRNRPPISR